MRKVSITGKSKFTNGVMSMSDANATSSVDWKKKVPSMYERSSQSFKVPTSKRYVSSESAISEGKELGTAVSKKGVFPVTPEKCRRILCPPLGAPRYKRKLINLEGNAGFPG